MPLKRIIYIVIALGLTLVQSISALGWRASYLPGSAMALALAGGGTALPENMSLTSLSPAHVWGAERETVEFGYLRMFGDLAGYSVRWQDIWRDRPVQLALRSMIEDDIELRDDIPTAEPLAFFSARLLSASLIRGWKLGPTTLGLSATLAYQRIYEYSAYGAWVSAGWHGELGPWLRWNLTVANLGTGEALNRNKDSVAPRRGAGVAIKTPLPGSYLALDLWHDEQGRLIPSVAWQTGRERIHLTAGMRWESEAPLLAAGFQLFYRRWTIGYATGYQSTILGQPHMFTIARGL
ncbi:MAG: hypothetical protein JSU61_03575 [Fidelibacterota bacterium]|nr:MAG: hypothetical protein JSU61_03575 [Candidatus Neomarinimicrobiota bacterium]